MTADDVLTLFVAMDLSTGERDYLKGQARRIAYIQNLVDEYRERFGPDIRILDIGPHFLTRCLMESLPQAKVSALGMPFVKLVPPERLHAQAEMDLNECGSAPLPFAAGSFDIIVFCEVVEHLFIPPDVILDFLRRMLKQPDGIIILGTPNAACLANRLRLMMGENPFHPLSADWRSGAGHIREYTMQELRTYGRQAGLKVTFEEYCDYWGQYIHIDNIADLEREVPSYRTGLSVVYQCADSAA